MHSPTSGDGGSGTDAVIDASPLGVPRFAPSLPASELAQLLRAPRYASPYVSRPISNRSNSAFETLAAELMSLFDSAHPLDLETLYGGPVILLAAVEARDCGPTVPSPFCVLTPVDCRGREVTKERATTLRDVPGPSPKWDEIFCFNKATEEGLALASFKVSLRNSNTRPIAFNNSTLISETVVPLTDLFPASEDKADKWVDLPIRAGAGADEPRPRIHLLGRRYNSAEPLPHRVNVRVIGAKLPTTVKSPPNVSVTFVAVMRNGREIAAGKGHTRVFPKSNEPVWNETFVLSGEVDPHVVYGLLFKIKHHRTVGQVTLGQVLIPLVGIPSDGMKYTQHQQQLLSAAAGTGTGTGAGAGAGAGSDGAVSAASSPVGDPTLSPRRDYKFTVSNEGRQVTVSNWYPLEPRKLLAAGSILGELHLELNLTYASDVRRIVFGPGSGSAFLNAPLFGWMHKMGGKRKNWKRRWFVLKPMRSTLHYYVSDAPYTDAKGVIDLRGARITSEFATDPKFPTSHSITIYTATRVWYLCTESSKAQSMWMSVLTTAIPYRGSFSDGGRSSVRESATASFAGSDSDTDGPMSKERRSSESGRLLGSPLAGGGAGGGSVTSPVAAASITPVSVAAPPSAASPSPPSSLPVVVGSNALVSPLATQLMDIAPFVSPVEDDASSGVRPVVLPLRPETASFSSRHSEDDRGITSTDKLSIEPGSGVGVTSPTSTASAAVPTATASSTSATSRPYSYTVGDAGTLDRDDFADVEAAAEDTERQLTEEEIEEAAAKVAFATGGAVEFPLGGALDKNSNVFKQLMEDRKRREKEAKDAEERRLLAMTPEERAEYERQKLEQAQADRRKSRRSLVQLSGYTSTKADIGHHHTRGRGGKGRK